MYMCIYAYTYIYVHIYIYTYTVSLYKNCCFHCCVKLSFACIYFAAPDKF